MSKGGGGGGVWCCQLWEWKTRIESVSLMSSPSFTFFHYPVTQFHLYLEYFSFLLLQGPRTMYLLHNMCALLRYLFYDLHVLPLTKCNTGVYYFVIIIVVNCCVKKDKYQYKVLWVTVIHNKTTPTLWSSSFVNRSYKNRPTEFVSPPSHYN